MNAFERSALLPVLSLPYENYRRRLLAAELRFDVAAESYRLGLSLE
jgi:hypothetical protein